MNFYWLFSLRRITLISIIPKKRRKSWHNDSLCRMPSFKIRSTLAPRKQLVGSDPLLGKELSRQSANLSFRQIVTLKYHELPSWMLWTDYHWASTIYYATSRTISITPWWYKHWNDKKCKKTKYDKNHWNYEIFWKPTFYKLLCSKN